MSEMEIVTTGTATLAATFYKNLESFPGQLQTIPASVSAKTEAAIARTEAVKGARHIERTSEHVRGGLDRKANMVVGAQLTVRPRINFPLLGFTKAQAKKLNDQFVMYWNDWAYDLRMLQDGEGHYDFGGLMWMAYRNLVGPDAETAGVIHYDPKRAAKYHHRWATFVTVVDPDRVSDPDDASRYTNARLYKGRELDEHGRMIALHIRKRHPTDTHELEDGVDTHVRVPRENVYGRPMAWHWFVKHRGGAQRGMTALVTSLRHATMLDKFDDAQLGAAVMNALFAVYAKSNAGPQAFGQTLAPAATDASGLSATENARLGFYEKTKMKVGANRIAVLPHQDSIEFAAVDRAKGDPTPFVDQFLRKFSMALGLSFEQFSNDYSKANYSSARAALLEVWRGVMVERRLFTRHVATQIYSAVIEEAIAKGWIELPENAPDFTLFRSAYCACDWIGPGMGWVDPLKEAQAAEIMKRNKFRSHSSIIGEAGEAWDEVFEQISDEEAYADILGLDLNPVATGTPAAGDGEDNDKTGQNQPKREEEDE